MCNLIYESKPLYSFTTAAFAFPQLGPVCKRVKVTAYIWSSILLTSIFPHLAKDGFLLPQCQSRKKASKGAIKNFTGKRCSDNPVQCLLCLTGVESSLSLSCLLHGFLLCILNVDEGFIIKIQFLKLPQLWGLGCNSDKTLFIVTSGDTQLIYSFIESRVLEWKESDLKSRFCLLLKYVTLWKLTFPL